MKGKKSFVLYADLIHTVDKLPDEKAGQLLKLILDYVNDKDPQTEDLILQISFEPIRQQLKRDLERWQEIKVKRSEAGKLGGRPKQTKAKKASALFDKQTKAKKAVNDNDNDNVNDNVINELTEQVSLINQDLKLPDQMIKEFLEYWTEPNRSQTKLRFQMEKTWDTKRRLSRWASNNFTKFTDQTKQTNQLNYAIGTKQDPRQGA